MVMGKGMGELSFLCGRANCPSSLEILRMSKGHLS